MLQSYRRFFCSLVAVTLFLIPCRVVAKISNDPEPIQWAYAILQVPEAWNITTGSPDTVVAVIDNGIDIDHPDLLGNIWRNKKEVPGNGFDDDNNGYIDDIYGWNFLPDDLNGDGEIGPDEVGGNANVRPRLRLGLPDDQHENISHATIVAGIIGARGDNGQNGAGINWHVKLMSIRVVDETGVSDSFVLGKAIRYAVDNGAHIINVSLVGDAYDTELRGAVQYAKERGVAIVAAAGNNLFDLNTIPQYPICADALEAESTVIGVSAIREGRMFAPFSNSGSNCIDITAPGVDIASTVANDSAAGFTETYARGKRGTSYAAPFVSGILALIKSVQPTWQAPQLYKTLFETVSKTPPQDEQSYASLFGRGLVQAFRAVQKAANERNSVTSEGMAVWRTGEDRFLVYDKNGYSKEISAPDIFTNAVQIETVFFRGSLTYVVLSRVDTKTARLRLYTKDFSLLSDKRISVGNDARMVVGFITNDTAPEVVMYTPNARVSYDVYSLFGVKRRSVPAPLNETVVSVTVVQHPGNPLGEVAVLTKNLQGEGVVRLYDVEGRVSHSVLLPKTFRPTSVVIANVTGDAAVEVVIAHTEGAGPQVSYLTYDGIVLQTFTIGEGDRKSSISVSVSDVLGDRSPEVIVTRKGSDVIRVFDGRPRLLDRFEFLSSSQTNKVLQTFAHPF